MNLCLSRATRSGPLSRGAEKNESVGHSFRVKTRKPRKLPVMRTCEMRNQNHCPVDKSVPFSTMAGRIECVQCKAKAKRSGERCLLPALAGRTTCRLHGSVSRGPRTIAGIERCARAKHVHGRETRAIRKMRSEKLRHLAILEALMQVVDGNQK